PIVSVRLYALRRVKDVEWTPRHVVRSRYHIELVYEAPGSPDGATVIGSAEDAAGDNRYATTQYALTADDAAGRRTTRILPYAYVLSIEPPAQSYVRERPVWPVRSEDEGCYWWQYSIRIDPFRLESLAYQIRFAGETEFGPYQDVPYMLPVEGHALYDLVFLSRLPCEDRWSFWEGHGNVRGIRIRAKSQDDCSTYVEQEIEVRLIDRTPEPEPEPDPEPPPSTPSGPRPDLVARLRAADVASTSVRARVVNEGSATVGSPFKVRVTGSIPFNHTIDVGVPIAPGMAWVDSEYRPVAASAEVFPRGFTVDADFLDQIDEGRNELNNGQTCTLFFTFGDWACMPALE
ncbi:MAG: hypothetical protein HY721_25920, partial [Planctomycetes bacterium]|nr:hypothetical protein [Planctomycetota bacterium]